jgi:integrase
MFLLFSIYGFRSAEVRGLAIEDIDWRRESIIVRRAKRGKTQQFPLQGEVGDAIALYLQKARPRCCCRNVFVTLHPPYRPVSGHSMSSIIGPRMKKLGIATEHFGPHMLRHACATQLLRTGSSLKDIADFLGHSDLRSVSSYVKCDPHSLKKVAEFGLRGVL